MMTKKLFANALITIGLLIISGCATSNPKTNYRPNSIFYKLNKPKVIQLSPSDCPWDKTYVIKNKPKHKVYGSSFAKKQNKKIKDAL